jgi:phosphoribosylanthranilate isomerase
MSLKLKVCGMRDPSNIREILEVKPDYMGFIFYKKSKRYAGDLNPVILDDLPSTVKRTGVFVDENLKEIERIVDAYKLDAVQLHGKETAMFCKALKELGLEVVKAFGIDANFNFSDLEQYVSVVDYFLFDTQTKEHGGSGKTFDWLLLNKYKLSTPYFLSGGIDLNSVDAIDALNDSRLFAVDVNSRFEITAGIKDLNKLINFKQLLF